MTLPTMRLLRSLVRRLSRAAQSPAQVQYPVTLYPQSQPARGRVLFSYLEYPLLWSEDDERFSGHTNNWESREIARIFTSLGYVVGAINWSDQQFVPAKKYDVLFDISINLQRLAPLLDRHTVKILHRTGSDPYYQNRAEMERVRALESRRKALYSPKRLVAYPDLERKSMQIADACSLFGSSHTLHTYPEEFRHKIQLVTISASKLGSSVKAKQDCVPSKREFLWFLGGGAVHKGLDLLLEVFARHRGYTLNIVGNVHNERDFMKIYAHEIMELPNIKYHGYLKPDSARFQEIVKDAFCFIAPSCSESISTAVVTCMQVGLYPIISHDTGVALPASCGIYLETCSIEEIESAVLTAYQMDDSSIIDQISQVQRYALKNFSRERFRMLMERFITRTIEMCGRQSGPEH